MTTRGVIDNALTGGRVDRAKITQEAQRDAAEAVEAVGVALEADEVADEAMRLADIAEKSGNRERAKRARKREREARKAARKQHREATKAAKQAYDAIKFSAPNKLGLMRVVQVLFALDIIWTLLYLLITSRDAMVYNVATIADWITMLLEGIAFWMFLNRYKIARPFVMGMAVFTLVARAAVDLATGQFNPFLLSFSGVFNVFLLFYFAFSKRVRAVLVNDISDHTGVYDKEELVIERHGWPFVRNLIIYFIVFSVLGHWMEMAMCQLIIAGLVEGEYDPTNTMLWRDWLYPFPMEGAAVVVIALALYPFHVWLKRNKPTWMAYLVSFASNALLCTVIEFGMGLIVNANHELWDYSENFGNIMGQVCLQNTMAFGVAASLITWFLYPALERRLARVPCDIMNIAFVAIAIFGGIIWSLYIVEPPASISSEEQDVVLSVDTSRRRLKGESDEEYERRMVAIELSMLTDDLEGLEETIESASHIDKTELQKEAEAIRERVAELQEKLGYDELPEPEGGISVTTTL